MRRYSLYLDSSFWKRLGDTVYLDRRRISFRFLRAVEHRHEILISQRVKREVAATPDPYERRHLIRRISAAGPRVLTMSPRIAKIAEELLVAGGWGEIRLADMLHVGYSIVGGADALVTWDVGDLARDRTRTLVSAYGKRTGAPVPLIGTPQEVAGWLNLVTG